MYKKDNENEVEERERETRRIDENGQKGEKVFFLKKKKEKRKEKRKEIY